MNGILSEIGRVDRVHNLDKYDEHFVSLFRMISRIDDYIKATSTLSDFALRSEKEILPYIEKITQLHNSLKTNNSDQKEIDDLLWSMMKMWRLDFIKFLENPQPPNSFRQQQEAPENPEATELINEITKHIEEETGLK